VNTDDWRRELAALVARGLASYSSAEVAAALRRAAVSLAAGSEAEVEPLRPPAPVLGVDACRGGWVGVLLRPDGRATVHLAATIGALVDQVWEFVDVAVVAIDIPIGLPDSGVRKADVLARQQLPGKSSSVFATLTRAAYLAPTYAEARAGNLEATSGQRDAGPHAYGLRAKILDVDGWLQTRPQVSVIEVHPELCFARMAGAPLLEKKKDSDGRSVRRDVLQQAGIVAPAWYSGLGFAEDDLLDACAAAWSAARYLVGEAESLPDEPEIFSDGIAAAIWV
jgi:predicted RNase H-like nuclease